MTAPLTRAEIERAYTNGRQALIPLNDVLATIDALAAATAQREVDARTVAAAAALNAELVGELDDMRRAWAILDEPSENLRGTRTAAEVAQAFRALLTEARAAQQRAEAERDAFLEERAMGGIRVFSDSATATEAELVRAANAAREVANRNKEIADANRRLREKAQADLARATAERDEARAELTRVVVRVVDAQAERDRALGEVAALREALAKVDAEHDHATLCDRAAEWTTDVTPCTCCMRDVDAALASTSLAAKYEARIRADERASWADPTKGGGAWLDERDTRVRAEARRAALVAAADRFEAMGCTAAEEHGVRSAAEMLRELATTPPAGGEAVSDWVDNGLAELIASGDVVAARKDADGQVMYCLTEQGKRNAEALIRENDEARTTMARLVAAKAIRDAGEPKPKPKRSRR